MKDALKFNQANRCVDARQIKSLMASADLMSRALNISKMPFVRNSDVDQIDSRELLKYLRKAKVCSFSEPVYHCITRSPTQGWRSDRAWLIQHMQKRL